MYTRIGIAALAILALGNQPARPQDKNSLDGFALVDKSGNIRKPTDYRDLYQALGTYVVRDPKEGDQTHVTYASHVEDRNIEAYKKAGEFPEGTLIVKELTLVHNPTFSDGSRTEPSGRGFFNGTFNGIDVTLKDSKRFAKTNGWGFFAFGHHAMPYAESAEEAPVGECAGCHMANVATTDMIGCSFIPCSSTNESVNA